MRIQGLQHKFSPKRGLSRDLLGTERTRSLSSAAARYQSASAAKHEALFSRVHPSLLKRVEKPRRVVDREAARHGLDDAEPRLRGRLLPELTSRSAVEHLSLYVKR